MCKQSRLKVMETKNADVQTCRNNIRGKPVSPTHPGSHHVGTLNGGPIARPFLETLNQAGRWFQHIPKIWRWFGIKHDKSRFWAWKIFKQPTTSTSVLIYLPMLPHIWRWDLRFRCLISFLNGKGPGVWSWNYNVGWLAHVKSPFSLNPILTRLKPNFPIFSTMFVG